MAGIICRISRIEEPQENILQLLNQLGHRGENHNIKKVKVSDITTCQNCKFTIVEIGVRTTQHIDAFIQRGDILYVIDSISSRVEDIIDDNRSIQNSIVLKLDKSGVDVWRSTDGQKAMYIAYDADSLFFASEKKCLWYAGLLNVQPVNPGQTIQVSWRGDIHRKTAPPQKQVIWNASKEDTLLQLEDHLRQSMNQVRGMKCGVLFSGGLDSSLIAKLAQEVTDEIEIFSAGTRNSRDFEQTEHAAKLLGIKRDYSELSPSQTWTVLPEVIYAAETCNRMDVEIALPFFVCARKAKEKGIETLLSGQGPDELFAGYAKHVKLYQEKGPSALEEELRSEVAITHETNISRDERVIAFNGISAFFPYLSQNFTQIALSLPAEWKITLEKTPERKVIFRRLAERLGLPEELVRAPKKATQFSSGSSKLLTTTIKENSGLNSLITLRQADKIVQDILNQIGRELGLPIADSNIKRRKIDLEPTHKLKDKMGISHPR